MSKESLSGQLELPPAGIVRGGQIMAEYFPQEVKLFQGNPIIESIPPALTPQEVTEYLLQLPVYAEKDRQMSQVARLQMTDTAREFYVPNGNHLKLYYAVTNMIRRGYVSRNPKFWEFWNQVHKNIASFLKAIKKKPFPNSRARGLSMVGSGGTGKSTSMEKILQSMPQVIIHISYESQDLIMKQLVWLKIDCPRQGSLRELCKNFILAVDAILGTNYEKMYVINSKQKSLDGLIEAMARVCSNHCLGLLVIDEMQDLSKARAGGEITMIDFLVHLENRIGVPFCLIGTQDALPLFSGQFRQLRRVCEQGFYIWDRMSEVVPEGEEFEGDNDDDDEKPIALESTAPEQPAPRLAEGQKKAPQPDKVWKNFIETMWNYQYVKRVRPLYENVALDKCAHLLYMFSKGNPAVTQTIFVLTQQHTILTGDEEITPRAIRDTVRVNQKLIAEMLGESRMKKPREIPPVGDLADFEDIYEGEELSDSSPSSAVGSKAPNRPPNESVADRNTVDDVLQERGGQAEKPNRRGSKKSL